MSSPSSPQSNTSPPVSEASADRKAGGVVNLPKDRFERVDLLEADPSADSDKSGQLGLTYRAFDRRLGRPVVVRSLAGTDAVSLYQLRQPLSRLRKIFHENLALVLDASLIGKQPFIVRDYLAGEGLMDAFRQAVEAQDHGRAAGWLAQVLEGLQVLERHGLSHGHVVAPNLRLVEGRVLLLDGGLRPGSPADDLIALTCLVKTYVDPLSPQTQGPWRHLAALDPSSGDPVKSLGRELRDLIGSFDLAPAASPILLDRPFVGREPELMKIHQAAMKTRRGQSVTMLVEGSPGLGRSALLAKSKRLIEERHGDALVLSAGCRRKTRDGGAMDALLLDLVERLNQLPAREVEVVLPARPRELTAGFPVFLRLESAATASSSQEERGDPGADRAVHALRQLFDRIAERRPLIMILDDAERADAQSLEVLKRVLEPPDPPPMMLLVGLDSQAMRSSTLKELIAPNHKKTSSFGLERLLLTPLNEQESRWMAHTLLGAESPKGLAEEIAAETEGLPSWIVRLVDDALDADELGVGEKASGNSTTAEGRSTRRGAALDRRLDELSPAARRLVLSLVLVERPVEENTLRRFHGPESESFEAVIDQLLSEDLIRFSSQGATFSLTDHLVAATLRQIVPDEIQDLHMRVAEALEQSGAAAGELARLWQAAGDFTQAAEAARVGARQASAEGRHIEAASLWQIALQLTPESSPGFLADNQAWAHALDHGGDFTNSARAYLKISELDPANPSWLRLAADRRLVNGDREAGLEWLAPLLERTGLGPLIEESTAVPDWMARAWRRARRSLAKWVPIRRSRAEDELGADVAWTLCRGLRIVDPGRASELSQEHLMRATRSRDPFRLCRALALETAHQAHGGWLRRSRVEKLGRRAIALARQLDEPRARGLAEVMAGEAWLLFGEWRRALSALDRGLLILESECPEAWWERRVAFFQQLRALAMLGKISEIAHLLEGCRQTVTVNRAPFLHEALESRFSWLVELAADRPREALQILERRRQTPTHAAQPGYWRLYGEIEIAIYRGDVHYAWHHLEEHWPKVVIPRLANIEFLRIEAWHQRARTALAALARRPEGAEAPALRRATEQAAGVLEAIASPWSEALAHLARAGLESLSADRYAAAETLQRAESRLDQLDMALLVQSCRRQRALLIPSAVATERLADADRRLAELGISSPENAANLYVPGHWAAAQ